METVGRRLPWIDEKDQTITPGMKFVDAGKAWIESRIVFLAPGIRARGYIKRTQKSAIATD